MLRPPPTAAPSPSRRVSSVKGDAHRSLAGGAAAANAPAGWRVRAAAALLVGGAFGVVLASMQSQAFDLDRYLVPKALVLHLTAAGLLALGFPSLGRSRWGAAEWLLLAFLGWSAAGALLASNRWLALSSWGIGASALLVLLAAREVGRTHRWPVLGGLVAAAALGAALGIAQAYGADWPWLADTRPPGGTFGNRNFLAHFSVLAVPPLVVIIAWAPGRRWLLPALVALGVLVTAVVLTRSRAAWLGGVGGTVTAVAVLLAYRRTPHPDAVRGVVAALAVLVAIAVAVVLPNQLRWTADSPYVETLSRLAEFGEGSGRGRLIQYGHSLALTREAPLLGVGPGNWFIHYPRVTQEGDPSYAGHLSIPTNPWPSSDWVAFVTERGVPGLLFLLLAGVTAMARSLSRAREGSNEERAAAGALAGLLVATVVTGSFDAVLLLAAPSLFAAVAVGLLLPDPRRALPWRPSASGARGPHLIAALLLLAPLADAVSRTSAMVLTRTSADPTALARAARRAPGEHRLYVRMAEAGDCEAADRAAALMPHHPEAAALVRKCQR